MTTNKDNILKHRLLNLILLIAALFIITVWTNRHFESSWVFVTLANLITVLLGVSGFVLKASTDEEDGFLKSKTRSLLLYGLNPSFLFILYFFLICVGSFLTTVTVYGEPASRDVEIRLSQEGTESRGSVATIEGDSRTAHFFRLTNPFGVLYSLEAAGYLRSSFELFPWVGKRIKLSDLQPVPTMFFRLYGPPQLFNNGRFEILFRKDTVSAKIENADRGALMLGQRIALPQSWKEEWERDLEREDPNQGAESKAAKANIVSGWNKFVLLDTVAYFSAGELITVKFFNEDGLCLGLTEVIMAKEPMQDYLIKIQ